jgi:hypothetical protein
MQHRGIAAGVFVAALVGAGVAAALLTQPATSEKSVAEAGPGQINACDMISAAEIQRVIGVPVREVQRQDDGITRDGTYSSTCFFNTSEDPERGGTYAILNAQIWPEGSAGPEHFLESFYEAAEEHVIPAPPIELPYGDRSVHWGDGVAVMVGNMSFGISVRHSSPDRSIRRLMEEMLAKQILENMGRG